jgi:hypothetical protein
MPRSCPRKPKPAPEPFPQCAEMTMVRGVFTGASGLFLAMTCLAPIAGAQDARACVNEVDRLSSSFAIEGGNDSAIAQRPSARQGASLQPEQHRQISDLLQQARAAGENGDGQACTQGLGRARIALRQAGIGSAQPGAPAGTGLSTGSSAGSAGGAAGTATVPGAGGSTRTGAGGADGTGAMGGSSGPAGPGAGSTGGGASTGTATGGAGSGGRAGGSSR